MPGVGECRVARGEWGPTLYVVLETHDVKRDYVIAEKLFPLRVEYELIPKRWIRSIPSGDPV